MARSVHETVGVSATRARGGTGPLHYILQLLARAPGALQFLAALHRRGHTMSSPHPESPAQQRGHIPASPAFPAQGASGSSSAALPFSNPPRWGPCGEGGGATAERSGAVDGPALPFRPPPLQVAEHEILPHTTQRRGKTTHEGADGSDSARLGSPLGRGRARLGEYRGTWLIINDPSPTTTIGA